MLHRYPRFVGCALMLGVSVAVIGCESDANTAKPALDKSKMALGNTPLYERLGGEPAVTAVVDDFVARAAANPAVNFSRKGTPKEWPATPENVEHLKKMLVQMFCQEAGGPHKYKGRDMASVHSGMAITAAEFDALAGDLKASLDRIRVPQREQNELLAIVGSTRDAVVGH